MDQPNSNGFYDIPQDFIDQFNQGMGDDAVSLPFTAPVIWWMNGDTRMKQFGGPQYFGGWACTDDSLEDAEREAGVKFPGIQATMVNNSGGEYEATISRSLAVAPICKRKRWVMSEYGKQRSHIQILCHMAVYDKQTQHYVPFGPVVLSGKGLSGKFIEDAFAEWSKRTAAARRQFAKNLPAWFFYAPVGTFGEQLTQKMVGSGNQQSPVTPAQIWVPQEIDAEKLRVWYVGNDLVRSMGDFQKAAEPWRDDWKKQKNQPAATEEIDEIPF